jgi:hypothetical protein
MKIRTLLAAAAALAMLASAGQAMAVTAAEVVDYCKPTGAFDQTFGAREANGPVRRSALYGWLVTPPSAWPPFTTFSLMRQPEGNEIAGVDGIAAFGDRPTALRNAAAIAAAVKATGRYPYVDEEDESFRTFATETDDEGGPAGLKLSLTVLGDELTFSCEDAGAVDRAFGQAMAQFLGTPTTAPVLPTLALPPPPPPAVCEDPAQGAALVAGLEDSLDAVLLYGRDMNQYGSRLMSWRGKQFEDAGVWTAQQSMQFGLRAFGEPDMSGFGRAIAFGEEVGVAMELRKKGDGPGACRAAVKALGTARVMVADAEKQWRTVDARYQAEAKRLGVKLD